MKSNKSSCYCLNSLEYKSARSQCALFLALPVTVECFLLCCLREPFQSDGLDHGDVKAKKINKNRTIPVLALFKSQTDKKEGESKWPLQLANRATPGQFIG